MKKNLMVMDLEAIKNICDPKGVAYTKRLEVGASRFMELLEDFHQSSNLERRKVLMAQMVNIGTLMSKDVLASGQFHIGMMHDVPVMHYQNGEVFSSTNKVNVTPLSELMLKDAFKNHDNN